MEDDLNYKVVNKDGDPAVGNLKMAMKGGMWKKLLDREMPDRDSPVAQVTLEQMKEMGLPGLTRGSNITPKKTKRK